MLKRLSVALAALFAFVATAHGAGTVPGFNLVPQFDLTGKVAPACKLYIIQAGTVSTPQNAYQDSGLTILQPNPLTCDASGRLPQWFVADGSIKLRLTTAAGTQIFVGDNLLVVGASSGGGGGSPVDPTTVLATGDFKLVYNTGILTGFVRCNGRTIGNATSGATERANADTSALFAFLYNADPNLTVSGGRGASAAADYAANKTLTLPDCRNRSVAGLGDMGSSDAGLFSGVTFSSGNSTTLGSTLGAGRQTLLTGNLPAYTPAGSVSNGTITFPSSFISSSTNGGNGAIATFNASGASASLTSALNPSQASSSFTGTPQGGASTPFSVVQPTILTTFYIKL